MGHKAGLLSISDNITCDYFGRLGGAGQYKGYSHWHCYALVVITVLDLYIEKLADDGVVEELLSSDLWFKTDDLPAKVRSAVSKQDYQPDEILIFLREVSHRVMERAIRKNDFDGLKGWGAFEWYIRRQIK